MRKSLFLDVTKSLMTVTDVSGQPLGLICKGQSVKDGCFAPVNGKVRSFRNAGKKLPIIKFQKSEGLIYTAAQA
jgi:hypothetical protein